jgi:drug/metabolite transporter (DMT)-like permease
MSTYAYVNPVVAVLLGSLLADEPLNSRILVAAAIIIGSVILINSARPLKVKAEPLPTATPGDD